MGRNNKKHRCCFTGHRPEKMEMPEAEIRERLKKAICRAINDGFTTFISGMARGIDMWAAEIVIEEKKKNNSIKLICVPPFRGVERYWSERERKRYFRIINQADFIKYICENYCADSFWRRNCFMVDHSSRVIAGYNGEPGGTHGTIKYALERDVEIENIFVD